jgi:hypothetical protein
VAFFTEGRDMKGVIYLILDKKWKVIDQRFFPAQEFLGMGIDNKKTTFIAMSPIQD